MGAGIAQAQLKRFWEMLAHYNGNQVNFSEPGRNLELSHTTIKNHLDALLAYLSMGASWEGFTIENILSHLDNRWAYSYYRTATQVEIDLVLHTPDQEVWAIEVKRASAPKLRRRFFEACKDVGATHKWIVNAYEDRYPLPNEVEVIGLMEFLELLKDKSKSV